MISEYGVCLVSVNWPVGGTNGIRLHQARLACDDVEALMNDAVGGVAVRVGRGPNAFAALKFEPA